MATSFLIKFGIGFALGFSLAQAHKAIFKRHSKSNEYEEHKADIDRSVADTVMHSQNQNMNALKKSIEDLKRARRECNEILRDIRNQDSMAAYWIALEEHLKAQQKILEEQGQNLINDI